MRLPQNNKRMRGRGNNGSNNNRRGPNPLTRSYESNGPDIKVRGTAAHIAEKYVQLARDAHVAGDPVAAESYLQHAEHYFRLIAAAHAAQNPQPRPMEGGSVGEAMANDETDDEDFDGGINDRFTYRSPQAYQAQALGQPFPAGENGAANEAAPGEAGAEQPSLDMPYGERSEARLDTRGEPRGDNRQEPRNQGRYDNRNGNRFEPRRDNRDRDGRDRDRDNRDRDNRNGERPPRNEFQRNDGRAQENGNRYDMPRRDRNPRLERQERGDFAKPDFTRPDFARPDFTKPERSDAARFEQPRPERSERSFEPRPERPQRIYPPEIADVQPILPSFITAPVRPVMSAEVEAELRSAPPLAAKTEETAEAPRPRRRRKVITAHEEGGVVGATIEKPAAE